DGNNPPEGYKSVYSKMLGHNALDIRAAMWQPVYACQNGWVHELQTEVERGLGIGIITDEKYFCLETGKEEHMKYRMWHFQALNVEKGQKIKTGQLVGWAGMTGIATGPHVHLELKPVYQN